MFDLLSFRAGIGLLFKQLESLNILAPHKPLMLKIIRKRAGYVYI